MASSMDEDTIAWCGLAECVGEEDARQRQFGRYLFFSAIPTTRPHYPINDHIVKHDFLVFNLE